MSTFLIQPTEEQEKVVIAFLNALEIPFVRDDEAEKLPDHVIKGIQKGIEEIEAGRYITMDEFKKKFFISK